MPTYTVRCPECSSEYEEVHKISENHSPCKECGHEKVSTIIKDVKFQLNGDGWASKEVKEERQEAKAFR